MPEHMLILAGVDTGGTFTDVVVLAGGRRRHCKVLSTPDDPSRAILEGLDRLGVADRVGHVVHGTTVGTNAVLEGKGARVAYVTSAGFADVLTLARQQRREVYQLRQPAEPPPVPLELCFEISTRIGADGELLSRAGDGELAELAREIEAALPEAVAINLLFSFLHPEEEARIANALGPEQFLSLSSRVLPEVREYERAVATWLNAYVGPVLSRYLGRLARRLPGASVSVMQSSGTTIAAEQAAEQAVRLLLSGPAGGLAAARLVARVSGRDKLLTFDMGGTSTDVALLDGEIPLGNSCRIGDWPLMLASVDIHTIGAGGGSIARVDEGGLLLVGPESAGADPGPACYAQGGELPTVTDANVVLGRIPADTLLGGYLPLDRERSSRAIDSLAAGLGCDRLDAARGVIRLANEHMARALRVISVERGYDPRGYTLFSFGGAGGLHACDLADLLDISSVMLPARAGVLSAEGMLASEPGRDLSAAILKPMTDLDDGAISVLFDELEARAGRQLMDEGVEAQGIRHRRELELRYQGQMATLSVDFEPGRDHATAFHHAHEAMSGHCLKGLPVELVNLRVSSRALAIVDSMEPLKAPSAQPDDRLAYMADLKGMVPIIERDSLAPGDRRKGPAVIREKAATSWLATGWRMEVDAWGNLLLERV